jgi:ATP-binding cassette subfamily C protein
MATAATRDGVACVSAPWRTLALALWREHRGLMLAVSAATAALLLTEGAGLLLAIPMLRLVGVDVGNGATSRVANALDATLRAVGVSPTLAGVLLVVVAVVAARAALQLALTRAQARLEADVVGRLRERLFAAVVQLPWARFAGERSGTLAHALGPQVDDVHTALLMLLDAASLAASIAAAIGVALMVSPTVTAVVALAGAVVVLAARAIRAPGRAEGDRLLAAASSLFARVSELLGAMKMIHAHGAEARAMAAVGAETRAWSTLTRRYARSRAMTSFVLAVIAVALLAALVWGAVTWLGMAPGTLLLLLLIYARIVPRISELHLLWSRIAQALASFDAISTLLARCESAAAGAPSPAHAGAASPALADAPTMALRGVTVRYPAAAQPVFSNLSVHCPGGLFTAVVGATGAGKTTLGDVMLGLLEPEGGEVLVDGVPLNSMPRAAWRSRLGYLAQEPMLFHGTIRENLLFAQPSASDAELVSALDDAACDFVQRLPQGLDAPVGDRGQLLSGGERQRLALARALLRRPKLLVLDEATSALDADTEARILQTVRTLRGRCTVVFCTHRAAVREAADAVVEL